MNFSTFPARFQVEFEIVVVHNIISVILKIWNEFSSLLKRVTFIQPFGQVVLFGDIMLGVTIACSEVSRWVNNEDASGTRINLETISNRILIRFRLQIKLVEVVCMQKSKVAGW